VTQQKRVLYRGVPVMEGWPEKILAAQKIVSLKLEGRDIPRIRYGKEESGWNSNVPCHDCGILEGEFHVPNCDVEECPVCRGQLLSCECAFDDLA
jgi:hypothetical protein